MSTVTHHTGSTLCFNASHHASMPPQGLALLHGVPTRVSIEQGAYLRTLGLEVQDDPKPTRGAVAPAKE